jgi:release factor glutamine methyltransferase
MRSATTPTPLHESVSRARARLTRAGIPAAEAGLDARLLAQLVLDWDGARVLAHGDETVPPGFAERYAALVERRASREPLAYIAGAREFWNLTFAVSPAVLIPRPETELVVETALAQFPDVQSRLSVADVGTGSGCLAVALAHDRPGWHVVATDVSADALAVASRNAASHGLRSRVRLVRTEGFDGIGGSFDLIVSNPPYVPERDRVGLQPEVRGHEPALALFAGHDGLSAIRWLTRDAARHLRPGGVLAFEFGSGQAGAVGELISAAGGLTMVDFKRDLQGIPRVALARRVGSRAEPHTVSPPHA